jgi:hypothetical protein
VPKGSIQHGQQQHIQFFLRLDLQPPQLFNPVAEAIEIGHDAALFLK